MDVGKALAQNVHCLWSADSVQSLSIKPLSILKWVGVAHSWKAERAAGKCRKQSPVLLLLFPLTALKKNPPSFQVSCGCLDTTRYKKSGQLTSSLFTMKHNIFLGSYLLHLCSLDTQFLPVKSLANCPHNLFILCTPMCLKGKHSYLSL